ncbi:MULTISPECIES: DUF1097 domain-containing protein [Shewanella]|uniref:DUF1097 domain-containing protein n=1 Tax=Shewanella chilikensis TaxID=558541 RepID=A0A6G7LTE5_9GAMM|nr:MULTISPECIES: DUF1097 domain-containing protein [Shewanella]MBZ4678454.1 hypothetical protein [Shewanella sp.]MCA0952097.1 DUF1097 domain-containing protein [Shewanella chilikensis]MCL1154433.1 DUF1097 domain-containing protein [Shewanella chilikensis]MCL1160309.1 DUF1097 domain-containing protein [Shewanella chilikensis]PYE58690.1 uncharacterized protein DUF1097 [Shewanella chilikensis]
MQQRWHAAISAGLLATVWCGVADTFGLITWIGFLGCSTFFAQGRSGFAGLLQAWCTNTSGVFWAWLIISGSSFFVSPVFGWIFTGIATSAMCLQACFGKLNFIPGAFIGCCITFAMSADIAAIMPPLLIGAVFGYAMSRLTDLMGYCQTSRSRETQTKPLPVERVVE